jgi:hypothetical protein
MKEERGAAGRGTAAIALVLALLTVALLAVAGWLWREGWRQREAARRKPAPGPAAVQHPAPRREHRARPVRTPSPPPESPADAQAPVPEPFQGQPVAFSVGQNQAILYQERPDLPPTYLIVLSPEYEVLGTLFLPRTDPVLPSRFLIKDASWGQGRRFGGQDVLLGVVACPPGTQDGRALRDAVSQEAWWRGKAVPAFQMDF